MPRFCSSCGAQMADTAATCPACGKSSAQSVGGGAAPGASTGGLADNVAALLLYLFGILAIIFLLIEPYNKNRFIRFHCFQCLFFWGGMIVLWIGCTILAFVLGMIPVIGAIVMMLLFCVVGIGGFVVWVLLMVKAYQGQMWKLPFIGDLAEKQAQSV